MYLLVVAEKSSKKPLHNSPIYDEGQPQSAMVLALLQQQAHQDDSNATHNCLIVLMSLFSWQCQKLC